MARHKLTDTKVKSAGTGWHGDGDGLWLRVSPSGSRSWVFVWVRHGRRREMGLGSYANGTARVSLSTARDKAEQVREILGRGGNPFDELPERRARIKPRTFGEIADELLAEKENSFRNPKHAAQWKMTLTIYAKPLRKIPVADVTTDDIVRVLRPLWREKNETARRLRGRIESVLDYAKALKLRDGENPARWRGHLKHVLGEQKKLQRGHFAAMPYGDVPDFMATLAATPGLPARALELCILTATRSGETLNAVWSEIDIEAKLWTVPPERTKSGKEHIVPLSDRAVALLESLHKECMSAEWVFPGRDPRKPISNMAMAMVMRRLKVGQFTPHGFRSAFRDWAGDATAFPRDIAEMALAHKVGDETELAYRRGSALAKRRKMMEAWAGHCSTVKRGNIVSMRSAVE